MKQIVGAKPKAALLTDLADYLRLTLVTNANAVVDAVRGWDDDPVRTPAPGHLT